MSPKLDSMLNRMLKKGEQTYVDRLEMDRSYKEGFNFGSMIKRQGKEIDNKLISYKPKNFQKGAWDGYYNG